MGKPTGMGAIFGVVLAVLVLFVAGIFMSPVFIAPAVLLLLFALFVGPLAAMIRGGDKATGTPSTSEASYDPVSQPGERTA